MYILGMYGLGSTELLVIFFVLVLVLLPYILYLVTLQNTVKLCAEHNRKMSPGEVWLVLIPLFGLVWYFIMVGRMADTIAAELRYRNIPPNEERPGYNVGLTLCILSLCGWIPVLGGLASIGALICWIIYWVRIAGYKSKLENSTFQFGQGNPNVYQFHNQFSGQPNPYMNQQQQNPYLNQQQNQNPNQQPPQQ